MAAPLVSPAALASLEGEGWHVSPHALLALLAAKPPSANGGAPDPQASPASATSASSAGQPLGAVQSAPMSAQQVRAAALDLDLRRFGEACLPDDVNHAEYRRLSGRLVVQVNARERVRAQRREDAESAAAAADEDDRWDDDNNPPAPAAPCPATASVGVDGLGGRGAVGGSGGRRLLRIRVTDGKRNASAVEMHPCPHVPMALAPGTKLLLTTPTIRHGFILLHPQIVQLLLTAPIIRHGFILLDPQTVQVLGGRVSPLYDEWDMQRRYSLLPALAPTASSAHSRSSRTPSLSALASSLPGASAGPPPFRGVTDARLQATPAVTTASTLASMPASAPASTHVSGAVGGGLGGGRGGDASAAGSAPAAAAAATGGGSTAREEGGGSTEAGELGAAAEAARERAVERARVEAAAALKHVAPHDRNASRKLLEKMGEEQGRGRGRRGGRGGRGRGGRGRDEEEEEEGTMTLEEYEARKAMGRQGGGRGVAGVTGGTGGMGGMGGSGGRVDVSSAAQVMSDEELARKLQAELDMEDMGGFAHAAHTPPHAHHTPPTATSASEQLRQSLFSFQPAAEPEGSYEGGRGGQGRRGRRGGGFGRSSSGRYGGRGGGRGGRGW
ncbi:unnamed protein product [Closterium sp. Naga37s-1]|nr:unnamed protein product [Closterium sp. Naga37s-1]